MSKNCYMTTIDLKDAYYLIPIKESQKIFLRFLFQGQLYEFNCLPFGLSTAPLIFTKLLKPVTETLRSKGIICVFYLDDILIISPTRKNCIENTKFAISLLEKLGFIINYEKSQIIPSQSQKFLGFMLNSSELCLELPEKKKEKIFN